MIQPKSQLPHKTTKTRKNKNDKQHQSKVEAARALDENANESNSFFASQLTIL